MTKKIHTVRHTRDSFVRRHRSFFVGLFVLIPLLVIPALLSYTLIKSQLFKQWVRFHALYDQNMGLAKGNNVSISGMAIGHVDGVTLVREGCIDVTFKVDPTYRDFIRKDTRAMLNQKNLVVGDWEVQLTGGSDSAGIAHDGDTLEGDYSFRIDRMTGQIAGMVEQVDLIIRQIAGGKGNLGRLLAEDTLINQVQTIVGNVNAITLKSTRMMAQVDSLLGTLNRTGVLGATLVDSVTIMLATVQKALGDATVIMDNVKKVSGDFAPMMDQVQDNLNQAEVMMRGLQKNWLVRQAVGKPEDKMLKDEP
ncbi:MAG: MCE family protein [Chitinispirillaceae bacterium]|nr:MCE family protein [Chitinispirillaceae bacterium]